jgi:mannose-6-phosphate isomerase
MRTVEKPWGHEIIWAETDDYVGKLLHINDNHRLSRQYHEVKEETIYVNSGTLTLEIGSKEFGIKTLTLDTGTSYHVTPGTVHRFCACHGDVELMEVSTPHLDDVVRLEDDYRRIGSE